MTALEFPCFYRSKRLLFIKIRTLFNRGVNRQPRAENHVTRRGKNQTGMNVYFSGLRFGTLICIDIDHAVSGCRNS
jgi:hypothetical protein